MSKIANFTFLAVLSLLCAAGCNKSEYADPIQGTATVAIDVDRNFAIDSSSVTVTFTPSENSTGLRYAIGLAEDIAGFKDGSLNSTTVEGNQQQTITFTDLQPISLYTVYAVATDQFGKEGEIASAKIVTDDSGILIENSFLLPTSAIFNIQLSSNYPRAYYYFGQDGDFDAFLSGELLADSVEYSGKGLYWLNLEPETDYKFFAKVIDRKGNTAKLVNMPIHTPAVSECPDMDLEFANNVYTGTYTFTPSNGCGRFSVLLDQKGTMDAMINNSSNWNGHIVEMIQTWEYEDEMITNVFESEGEVLDVVRTTPSLTCETYLEAYVLMYDESGEPVGIKYFTFNTPEFDENAPEAKAAIKVENISTAGAIYYYSVDENTLGCMYDTVDANWYDEQAASGDFTEDFLGNTLFSQGYYFHYNDGTESGMNWTFAETIGQPGTRYYAAACPMNANGIDGWGETVLVEYTTLAE